MKRKELQDAMAEAERFLARASLAIGLPSPLYALDTIYPGKQVASVRRASLDLTRALSALRKSGN